jgi:hypothetical protein
LDGITDNALSKDRRAFLCADAQKRLDKFVEFSYIAFNQLPKKSGLFKSSVRYPYLSTKARRIMSSKKFPSISFHKIRSLANDKMVNI